MPNSSPPGGERGCWNTPSQQPQEWVPASEDCPDQNKPCRVLPPTPRAQGCVRRRDISTLSPGWSGEGVSPEAATATASPARVGSQAWEEEALPRAARRRLRGPGLSTGHPPPNLQIPPAPGCNLFLGHYHMHVNGLPLPTIRSDQSLSRIRLFVTP